MARWLGTSSVAVRACRVVASPRLRGALPRPLAEIRPGSLPQRVPFLMERSIAP